MTVDEIKQFLKVQIPPGARRASLVFAMQAAAADELKRLGAVDLAENSRAALDRLRREAEDAGAKPMGLAAIQSAAPTLMDQMLRMLD
jgi:hypothetical protein